MAGLTAGCTAGCCEEEDDSVSRAAVEVFAKLKVLRAPGATRGGAARRAGRPAEVGGAPRATLLPGPGCARCLATGGWLVRRLSLPLGWPRAFFALAVPTARPW